MTGQLPLDLKFLPVYGREDFLITESNAFASFYIDRWPDEWKPFPALTVYGQKGCGKSHLAAVWAERAGARFLSVGEFETASVDELIEAARNLVIDRLDLLVGDRAREEKLFHLYNSFLQEGGYILLMSHISPQKLDFVIPDLASRLRGSPSVEILPPDEDLLARVLAKRLHDASLPAGEQAIRYATARMERSWAAMDDLVGGLVRKATAEKRQITIPLVRDVLIQMESGDSTAPKHTGSNAAPLDRGPSNRDLRK